MSNLHSTSRIPGWLRLCRTLTKMANKSANSNKKVPYYTDLTLTHDVLLRTDPINQECPICKHELEPNIRIRRRIQEFIPLTKDRCRGREGIVRDRGFRYQNSLPTVAAATVSTEASAPDSAESYLGAS